MPRKVKVGPSKETILVLGGELATHLVTTDSCLQSDQISTNENLPGKKAKWYKSRDETRSLHFGHEASLSLFYSLAIFPKPFAE